MFLDPTNKHQHYHSKGGSNKFSKQQYVKHHIWGVYCEV